MSMELLPLDAALSPALAALYADTPDDYSTGQSPGFPVISIKGKVFHIKRGDERELVMKPGSDDEPAASLEVVVIATHPGVAKTYYEKGYVEGSVEKPDCYSNDGITPAADAQDRQAKQCAVCPHNQWGSRITEDGKKGKNCADVKRLAVAPAGQLNDPMLLRVPATSLTIWNQYVESLKKHGRKPPMVVTKIGFDYSVAHPALTFRAIGAITEKMALEVHETKDTDTVQGIIGVTPSAAAADAEARAPHAAPSKALTRAVEEAEASVAARPAKPKPKIRVEEADEAADEPPPAKVAPAKAPAKARPKIKVEEAGGDDDDEGDAEAPPVKEPVKATAKPNPKPKVEAASADIEADDALIEGLDEMLDELGFDG